MNGFRRLPWPALLLAGLTASGLAMQADAQGIYKWTDKNGAVHYGDQPTATSESVNVKAPRPDTDAAAGDSANLGVAATEAKAAQCAELKKKLAQYQGAASIDETNALGEKRRYSDAERQQLISQTQASVDSACSGG